jgi:hypothetical protein
MSDALEERLAGVLRPVFWPHYPTVESVTRALLPVVEQEIAAARAEALREAVEGEAFMEPWGPFPMGGFEGCTDPDPAHCACATDEQPKCEVCGQEIEPGEMAWARNWPCYPTLPLDHRDQDWDVISWHDECPRAVLAGQGGESGEGA